MLILFPLLLMVLFMLIAASAARRAALRRAEYQAQLEREATLEREAAARVPSRGGSEQDDEYAASLFGSSPFGALLESLITGAGARSYAIARRRGEALGTHDSHVNQLLAEIDGISGQRGVFVIGATNRPDQLDPALLRGGWLSRTIVLGSPTRQTVARSSVSTPYGCRPSPLTSKRSHHERMLLACRLEIVHARSSARRDDAHPQRRRRDNRVRDTSGLRRSSRTAPLEHQRAHVRLTSPSAA